MADTYCDFGSAGNNLGSGSGVILSGNGSARIITNYWLDYRDNGAYLNNYNNSGIYIYFYINGNHLMTATYTGDPRPSVSWSGSLFIPAWTNVTVSFQNSNGLAAMRNAFRLWIRYSDVSHPSVGVGTLIYGSQMSSLHYYKYGSYNQPSGFIYPFIIGSTGSIIYASTYNNA